MKLSMSWCAGLVALGLALGCGDLKRTDSRFATPERTVATLLAAHGISEPGNIEALEAQLGDQGGFAVVDRELYEACFVDLDEPGGSARAGYVLGMLAAAYRELRYETIEHRGYATAQGVRIAMQRGEDGAYRIVLNDSVPADLGAAILAPPEPAGR